MFPFPFSIFTLFAKTIWNGVVGFKNRVVGLKIVELSKHEVSFPNLFSLKFELEIVGE